MVMLAQARAPEGMRLYAIGDVHGRPDLLTMMHARVARDLERRPVADWRVIHLGDYIDRGPDSAGALALLAEYADDPHAEFLCGNHDDFLLDFLQGGGTEGFDLWMYNGGVETLNSFGLDGFQVAYLDDPSPLARVRERFVAAIAPEVTGFLGRLAPMLSYGDYTFVHAGVRPGVALEAQSPHDLIWIREPFLSSRADHGAVIVHGHTPVEAVEVRPNRIDIDTGAVFSDLLSCLVLEGPDKALLEADGPEPLAFIDC